MLILVTVIITWVHSRAVADLKIASAILHLIHRVVTLVMTAQTMFFCYELACNGNKAEHLVRYCFNLI